MARRPSFPAVGAGTAPATGVFGAGGANMPALQAQAHVLAAQMPAMMLEARHLAMQTLYGLHGRRRAGPGETFFEYRPLALGEGAARIDWRRSARGPGYFVREQEQESAATYWLHADCGASMAFSSYGPEKRARALVLMLALAHLLVCQGERAGLCGLHPPSANRQIIDRFGLALAHGLGAGKPLPLPEAARMRERERVVLFSDFIVPLETLAAQLKAFAARGIGGVLVLLRDPAEADFPFSGESVFFEPGSPGIWPVGQAQLMRTAYQARLAAFEAALARLAQAHGFALLRHRTDHPAALSLLDITVRLGARDFGTRTFDAHSYGAQAGSGVSVSR